MLELELLSLLSYQTETHFRVKLFFIHSQRSIEYLTLGDRYGKQTIAICPAEAVLQVCTFPFSHHLQQSITSPRMAKQVKSPRHE